MRANRTVGAVLLISSATLIAAALIGKTGTRAAAQSGGPGAGYRLLQGAIDLHFHIDPDTNTGSVDAATIEYMRFARAQGLRGMVIKNHWETTASVAYLIRKEIPGLDAFGGIVLNRNQGGINLAMVEYMATQMKGKPGIVVWMPTRDAENIVRKSDQPNRPFVKVSENGQLLPEVKQMIALIAKHDLVLATGHLSPAEGLEVLREARRQGAKRTIVTHPMDAGVFMNAAQMREAIALGAFLEFDFRNVLTGKSTRPFQTTPITREKLDIIREVGPENVIIDEFWSKGQREPREYGGPDEMAAWVKAMNEQGFSNRELDLMCKENPAKLLGLPVE
ncbi:MAG: hypothetical protein FJW23_07320 [Acidimicrobiia bacterium]|nr:hypothetical protein [Acidimicrobiia bacterium]